MILDKVILKQVAGGTQSDPLWGEYQTFVLDIDNENHRLWLNKQYKLGAVMVDHSYTNSDPLWGEYQTSVVRLLTIL